MSFEEQWAAAREHATARMQLNSEADIDGRRIGPGSTPSLDVTPSLLQERGREAGIVRGDFLDTDNRALEATKKAPAGLKGWATASALQQFATRWGSQMKYVGEVLERGVSTPLQQAGKGHEENEIKQSNKARAEAAAGKER